MDATVLADDYWWPTSEQLPRPEGEDHLEETIYLVQALRAHFRRISDISVKAGLFIFHAHGGPAAHLEPDIFVVKDAPQEAHSLYQLCIYEKPPCMVIEVTSNQTIDEDLSTKKDLYERIGIPEYFLHDVRGETLTPSLQGYLWTDGRYEAMAEEDGALISQTTGLILKPEINFLRLIDAATGKPLMTYREAIEEIELLRGRA